jgi:hypothetical protein
VKENKDASVLVGIAAGWAIVLIILAAVLPIVTPQGSPTVSSPTSSSSPATGIAPELPQLLQVTLVAHYGNSVLIPMALPALASLIVGLLLWLKVTRKSRWAGIIAWAFAGVVLIGGVIGFVTFFFKVGLSIVPIGVLLLMACNSVAPQHAM